MTDSIEKGAGNRLPRIAYSHELPRKPEKIKPSKLVVVTDIEGPHILGDTYLSVMAAHLKPEFDTEGGHGIELFEETYQWFLCSQYRTGVGQDGSDIVCHLPSLLLFGVTDQNVLDEARKSQRTPGSKEYVSYLRSKGAIIVGITTAWDGAHRGIVLNDLGLDGMIGTQFSLDKARQELLKSGKWEEEMELTQKFLTDCFHIITKRHWATRRLKDRLTLELQQRINRFYVEELGIAWDQEGDMISTTHDKKFKTEIADIMHRLHVVGDKRKARVARAVFDAYALPGAVRIAIGDGLNDALMLRETPWSIGINGAAAASAAAIGVITKDAGVLSVITDFIIAQHEQTRRRLPFADELSTDDVQAVVEKAQFALGERAIVRIGGRVNPLSSEELEEYRIAKLEWRGVDAAKVL